MGIGSLLIHTYRSHGHPLRYSNTGYNPDQQWSACWTLNLSRWVSLQAFVDRRVVCQQVVGRRCRRYLEDLVQDVVEVRKERQNSRSLSLQICNLIRTMQTTVSETQYRFVGISSKPISKKICRNSCRTLFTTKIVSDKKSITVSEMARVAHEGVMLH